MDFAIDTPYRSPFLHIYHPKPHPSSQPEILNFLYYSKKHKRVAIACIRNGNPNDDAVLYNRRTILFMSLSILPLLKSRAQTLPPPEDFAGLRTQEMEEYRAQGTVSANLLILSLINEFGTVASAMLGALFVLAYKEKATTEATVKSRMTKLKENEADIISVQSNFEREMQNVKGERGDQLQWANEERVSLIERLQLAECTVAGIGLELQKENKVVKELEGEIYGQRTNYPKAGEDGEKLENDLKGMLNSVEAFKERIQALTLEFNDKEDNICNLRSVLAAKEPELRKMSSICKTSDIDVAGLSYEIEELELDIRDSERALEDKDAMVDDLNLRVRSLFNERDELKRKIDVTEDELHQLKKEELAINAASMNEMLVSHLTQENIGLRRSLHEEVEDVKNLEQELKMTQDALEKSRNEVFDFAEALQESRKSCSKVEAEILKVLAESAEARELLETNLVEAKRSAEVLAGELRSTKETLNRTNEEMLAVSGELADAAKQCGNLQKELVDVYKKAESAVHELKEEKSIVASLNKELTAFESQKLKDNEVRMRLERDLEEATKLLDEMNQNAVILSRDLEFANAQVTSLEDEKDLLCKTIIVQDQLYEEARENMKEFNNLVMGVKVAKEKMDEKTNKLKDELASAKGEILRLKCEIRHLKASVELVDEPKGVQEGKAKAVAVKRTKRKKVAAQKDK